MAKTGIIYDDIMLKHKCPWDGTYPERPERLSSSLEVLKSNGLLERCQTIPPRSAADEEILLVHTQEHLEKVEEVRGENDNELLEELSSQYDSVYFNEYTSEAARRSAGCSIKIMEEVINGRLRNGFALVRPPGHHGLHNESCGYCIFNNVAIAARTAIEKHNVERVLIVDWDVHHGQGTQRAFYNDDRVLYFSIHRYEDAGFWPHLPESNFNFTGADKGLGYNVNVPLNATGYGDADYLHIFKEVLLPITEQYKPQLILISAGFDAALGDPKGEMKVSPQCYSHLCSMLMRFADGKVVAVLEGGYCLDALSYGVLATARALLSDDLPPLPYPDEGVRVQKEVEFVKGSLKQFWDFPGAEAEEGKVDLDLINTNVMLHKADGPPFKTRDFHGIPHCSDAVKAELDKVIALYDNFYK